MIPKLQLVYKCCFYTGDHLADTTYVKPCNIKHWIGVSDDILLISKVWVMPSRFDALFSS